ncbi:DNA repair protein RecO [Capnocytophaga canis]|uniref:DNA repair protein RecO n=1 Tax=Capnocytophaga canis TaxID=1848903 RepID=A0A0B7IT45_9FLAO|nr:DNA repair protein RecO [Capnocytophaga canis]CEN53197.1 DNA repair protein RecO [Capnocytophaga canis]
MYIKTDAIVISSMKYTDSSLIVKCFTKEYGMRSYLLQGVLSSKKTTLKTALFQPFTQLELIALNKDSGTLGRIKEAKLKRFYRSLHTNVLKSSVVMLLSEISAIVCNVEHKEPEFYRFLEEKLHFFDENEFSANFHLKFLVDMTYYLGFYPNTFDDNHQFFNVEEGIFTTIDQSKYSISGEALALFKRIIQTSYTDLESVKTNRIIRNSLLNSLLKYYEWHFPNFKRNKSLEVLQTLF